MYIILFLAICCDSGTRSIVFEGVESDPCWSLIKLFVGGVCGIPVQRKVEIKPASALLILQFFIWYLFAFLLSSFSWRRRDLSASCSFGVKSGEIKMLLIFSGLSFYICSFEMFLRIKIFSDSEDTVILSSLGFLRHLPRQKLWLLREIHLNTAEIYVARRNIINVFLFSF